MSSPLAVGIRPATIQDVGVLVELMRLFYAESSHLLDAVRAEAAFVELLAHPELGGIWIAQQDDIAVGYVVLTVRYSMDYGALCGHIDDLFVRSTHRRQHIGRRLLTILIEECRLRQCGSLHVEVGNFSTPAIELYRSFGLKEFGDGRMFLHGTIGAAVA